MAWLEAWLSACLPSPLSLHIRLICSRLLSLLQKLGPLGKSIPEWPGAGQGALLRAAALTWACAAGTRTYRVLGLRAHHLGRST